MRRPAWCLLLVLAAVVLAAPAAARDRRTIKLRFPRFTVPPGASAELCYFVRVPATVLFDLGSFEIRNLGQRSDFGTLHMLVYHYEGERLGEWAPDERRVIPSRACLDLGPVDRDRRQIVAGGTLPRNRGQLPPGVAWRLMPAPAAPGGSPAGIGILLAANWDNASTRPRKASARVVLRAAKRGTVRRVAQSLYERSAELGLLVPPGTIGSTEDSTAALDPTRRDAWSPSANACVVSFTGRMHKRGRLLAVDHVAADGTPVGAATVPNPFEPGRTHLFATPDYTDPGVFSVPGALLVRAGEALRYGCWSDNGITTFARLGCEETPGNPPGLPEGSAGGGPAKPCTAAASISPECPPADPAFPGRSFTGTCVAANLVAGPTPDDEACALTGASFEAVPGAGCDLNGLPPIL